MIITNLVGGLGNQMFQYACAYALAKEIGTPLKVTVDMFGEYTFHNGPELERAFSIELDPAGRGELRHMIGALRGTPFVRRALTWKKFAFLRGSRFIVEPGYRYWPELLARARGGAYLQGYWQSERYFLRYASAVRKEFVFRDPLNGRNAELAHQILGSNAVSVHVRRGDYASDSKTLATHGVCRPEYYFTAIESVCRRVPGVRLFAFSDDPEWVAETLLPRYPGLTVVDHNQGLTSYNDMRLMSLCHHHIVANSSFSWWGAWLNPNPDKIVIAPQNWFANGIDARDLVPADWERL